MWLSKVFQLIELVSALSSGIINTGCVCVQVDTSSGVYTLPYGADTDIKPEIVDNSVDIAVCFVLYFYFILTEMCYRDVR